MFLFEINHTIKENEIPKHNTVPPENHEYFDLFLEKVLK